MLQTEITSDDFKTQSSEHSTFPGGLYPEDKQNH